MKVKSWFAAFIGFYLSVDVLYREGCSLSTGCTFLLNYNGFSHRSLYYSNYFKNGCLLGFKSCKVDYLTALVSIYFRGRWWMLALCTSREFSAFNKTDDSSSVNFLSMYFWTLVDKVCVWWLKGVMNFYDCGWIDVFETSFKLNNFLGGCSIDYATLCRLLFLTFLTIYDGATINPELIVFTA